jgi:siderophore synthetase component
VTTAALGTGAPRSAPRPPEPRAAAAPGAPAGARAAEADRLVLDALLRCWVRERRLPRPADDHLTLDLGAATATVRVRYWSATGMHRFETPHTAVGPLSPAGLAALLAEAAGSAPHCAADLVDRVAESADRIAAHLTERAVRPSPPPGTARTPFLIGEQALLAGHPLHPTPKSRDGIGAYEAAAYSPELRGSFPLHWFAADPALIGQDSEMGPSAAELTASLSGLGAGDAVAIPAHPWQAKDLLTRPRVRELLASGRLRHLGPGGPDWYPTSSLRTVYRPDVPVMLKLSLGLRITNSRRENLRKELLRGVEAHRLLAMTLGADILAAHPGFRLLTDAAYLATPSVPGLDVSFRHAPFRAGDHVYCVAAFTDLGRGPSRDDGHPHELSAHISALAEAEGRPVPVVAADFFVRYVRNLIVPMLWLDAQYGVTLEGHQQNTLLQFDESGYPVCGWYRDNQGFYYRSSRAAELAALCGRPDLGEASETIADDDVVTERLLYYVGINNLLGMVGAFGTAGLADERHLLGLAAQQLEPLRGHRPVDLLLTAASLRVKANLLTRSAGLDELAGSLAEQSVYVDMPNPLHDRSGARR